MDDIMAPEAPGGSEAWSEAWGSPPEDLDWRMSAAVLQERALRRQESSPPPAGT